MTRPRQGLVIVAAVVAVAGLLRAYIDDRPLSPSAPSDGRVRSDVPNSAVPAFLPPAAKPLTAVQNPEQPGPKVVVISRDWTPRPRFPNASLALAALKPLAEQGDTKAMIGISRALSICRLEPPDEADKRWSKALAARSGFEDLFTGSDFERKFAEGFKRYCTLSHDEVFSEYRTWLLRAADAGDSEAQLLASMYPPFDADYKEKAKRQIDRADGTYYDFLGGGVRELALKYAKMAADQGEVWAVMMARSHEQQLPDAERNPREVFLYSTLMSRIPKADGTRQNWDHTLEFEGKALRDIDRQLVSEESQKMLARPAQWIWRPRPSSDIEWAQPDPE